MIVAIEAASSSAYVAAMRSILLRLIALMAVLLMPLGMSPAAASPEGHRHSASMPMRDCPDQGSRHRSNAASAECTMACASALPAMDRVQQEPMPYERLFAAAAPARALQGLHPETATPPPKIA